MPLQIPTLDDRRYQELLHEALARVPVHNPEWTNFNASDPGVTLVEIFAFMTENLLYRANLMPERNRLKFLSLLGVPLQPAAAARALVTLRNERGPFETLTLNRDLELQAGPLPFRTEAGLDVLPVEWKVFYKRRLAQPAAAPLLEYYSQLYASYQGTPPADLELYETALLDERNTNGVALEETIGNSLWVALLARPNEKPEDVRAKIAGKTISLGVVPALTDVTRALLPNRGTEATNTSLLTYEIPVGGLLGADRLPRYRPLEAKAQSDVLTAPGVVEITLLDAPNLTLWSNLDPLEAGVNDFPPALDDTNLNSRLVTWVRVRGSSAVKTRLLWLGLNTVFAAQREHIANQALPDGTGEPNQMLKLGRAPVLPQSVRLFVNGERWEETDDLLTAGPEIVAPDLRQPPGAAPANKKKAEVFQCDPEAGVVKCGDGLRGKRFPAEAVLRVSFDYSAGGAGNVGAGSIKTGPALPTGFTATNHLRAWGGADAERVSEGEKHIPRFLQHRERLVTATDFETIALRTPGVDIGRVEVIPTYNPELQANEPGDAPGAVTLMLIPRYAPCQPDAPQPDRLFLDAVCRHLETRRLVTTEIFLRGPVYVPIWVSVGINILAGQATAEVREAVKAALLAFLAPLRQTAGGLLDNQLTTVNAPQYGDQQRGWPLRKPVTDRELLAVASRVPGVMLVNDVKIAAAVSPSQPQIPMTGLQLPRVLGISVTVGEPLDINQLRGATTPASPGATRRLVPVPVIPDEC